MDWYIHHVNVPSHDVSQARVFYRDVLGLPEGEWRYPPADARGQVPHTADTMAYFGTDNRGIHVVRPSPTFASDNGFFHNPTIGGHFAITVSDLATVMARLDRAGIIYSDARTYAMAGMHQIYVLEPGMRVLEINQVVGDDAAAPPASGEAHAVRREPGGWYLHHVNMQAFDVRATAAFLADIVGLEEGEWSYPAADQIGTVARSRDKLTNFGRDNRGIHIVKPSPSFAADNGFHHNPTIGGHFAITVEDIEGVIARLRKAEVPFTDAGTYAMAGIRQVYAFDPSMNFVEINALT